MPRTPPARHCPKPHPFQIPYFQKLCAWKAASVSNPAAKAEEPADAETLLRGISRLSQLPLRLLCFPRQPHAPSTSAACAAQTGLLMPAHSACAARAELVEHVEECELEAIELLLKCLYKVELTEEAQGNGQLLLQVYRLADKYLVPDLYLQSTLAALAAFEAKDIDLPLLSEVYNLPTRLLEVPCLHDMIAACAGRLMELFGHDPAVLENLEQQRLFCTLPHAAVLAWLQCDDHELYPESCVLLLLSAWVDSKEHSACSPDELKQLAHSVRAVHLVNAKSFHYFHRALPDLKGLWEPFHDVPAVITDMEKRRQFCALPFMAVLAWLLTSKCTRRTAFSSCCLPG